MPEKEGKYYKYPVTKDTTVSELISGKISLFKGYENDLEIIFLLEENNGVSNLDNIYRRYTDEEQKEYELDYIGGRLELIKSGTTLFIDESKINTELVTVEGSNLFIEDAKFFQGYFPESLRSIQNNEGNRKVQEEQGFENQVPVAQLKNYNASVWIYSKALDQIIDVTPFLYNLSTSSSMDEGGGSFNLTLDGFSNLEDVASIGADEYVNIHHLEQRDQGSVPISYYAKNLAHKDLVFIRFEKLELETQRTGKASQDLIVGEGKIAKNVYDMIGLIDSVVESVNPATNDKTVSIDGQDLTKLLSDDAAYFYPIMFADGADTLLFNTQDDDKIFKRTFITGNYESFFTYLERSVRDSIGFVINQLSNLGVVKDSLFNSYVDNDDETGELNDKRTKVIRILNDEDYIGYTEANGVWQIIDILTDPALENRRQVDSLLVKSEGTLLDFMNTICQKPFVEFYGDTYGDKFAMIARQPPFSQEAILTWLNQNNVIEINSQDIYSMNLSWETEFYTWYQIEPNNSFLGYDKYTSLSYIPIIYFPTIADTFGNHRYTISDSYIAKAALIGSQKDLLVDPFRSAVVEDLSWVIETTQYLPFTRKGTITIAGDRRIKKGTWIYLKPTNEICYVKQVQQSMVSSRNTIDRTTTLTLERCMVRDFIREKIIQTDKGVVKASYFNIIDTETIKRQINKQFTETQNEVTTSTKSSNITTKKNFDVNKDVFDFFINRGQFKSRDQQDYFNRAINPIA